MGCFTNDVEATAVALLEIGCRNTILRLREDPTASRPLWHLIAFILTAVYTGTRSHRVWTASYQREEGRPWLDLEGGVYYREAQGERAPDTKRANSVRIPGRLLAHMKRWHAGPIVEGKRKPRRYLVQYNGRAADPKISLEKTMRKVFGEHHPYVRHTFRHTCATWLMWSGGDVGDIASFMSMTREVVVKVYGKEHPDADRAAGDAFTSGSAGRRRGKSYETPASKKKVEESA